MQIEHHDRHREFPEYREHIHQMKLSDGHFARLFNQFDRLDHEVRRMELADSLISAGEMKDLKLSRVLLEEELYAHLKNG